MINEITCPVCPDKFESLETLAEHLATYHLAQTRGRYCCPCGGEFTVKELALHLVMIQGYLFRQHFKKHGR